MINENQYALQRFNTFELGVVICKQYYISCIVQAIHRHNVNMWSHCSSICLPNKDTQNFDMRPLLSLPFSIAAYLSVYQTLFGMHFTLFQPNKSSTWLLKWTNCWMMAKMQATHIFILWYQFCSTDNRSHKKASAHVKRSPQL